MAAGASEAVAELYDRHSSLIFGLALRVTNDRALAEDATQETFVAIWKNAARFDPACGSVRTWILAIAHNRAVDTVRRRRVAVLSLEEDSGAAETVPACADVWPEVSARFDTAAVTRAFASLPKAQRLSIELAYFGGLTQNEIAAATGVALGTAKGRVRLGLARLRELLWQEYEGKFANDAP